MDMMDEEVKADKERGKAWYVDEKEDERPGEESADERKDK